MNIGTLKSVFIHKEHAFLRMFLKQGAKGAQLSDKAENSLQLETFHNKYRKFETYF